MHVCFIMTLVSLFFIGSRLPRRTGLISRQRRCQSSYYSLGGLLINLFFQKLERLCLTIFSSFFQALKFLSEFQPNRSKMREEIGMVISLKTIMHKDGKNAKARQMAKEVYQNIIPPVNTTSSKRTKYEN